MLGTISENILKWKAARSLEKSCRATTVAVCSRKGGVGKTTTTVHLAVAAARFHHRRVLVIDMDPQGHVQTAMEQMVRPDRATGLSNIFLEKKGDILDACVPTTVPNLWLAPADDRLEQVQVLLSTRIGREFVLKSMLARAEDMFDLIVIDCPPNLDTLTLNALVASRYVLVPTDLSLLALEGVGDISEAVDTVRERLGLPVEIGGILVTKVDNRNKAVNRELTRMAEQRFGGDMLEQHVPGNTAVTRACLRGQSVYEYAPKSRASVAYLRATHEFLDRIET